MKNILPQKKDSKKEIKEETYKYKIKNNMKSIFEKLRKNKKVVAIFVAIVLVLSFIFARVDKKYNIVEAFLNRNQFIIQTESKYIGLGEEVSVQVATALFQSEPEEINLVASDTEVVSTSQTTITGKSLGKTTIYGVGDKKTSNEINIECIKMVEEIILSQTDIKVETGSSVILEIKVLPEDATYKTISFKSSDENIATVKNGIVYGQNIGQCIIYTTDITGKVVSECNVEVTYVETTDVELDDANVELGINNKYILSATVYPENATDKTVSWSSSDENILTVENGIIKAKNIGQAQVFATTADGLTTSCTFYIVQEEPNHDIKYAKDEALLKNLNSDNTTLGVLEQNTVLQVLNTYDGYIKVRTQYSKVGYVYGNDYTTEKSYVIKGVPYINQKEIGYPTGCEAVSATMVAKYMGYDVEVEEIIENTPTDERGIWTEEVEAEETDTDEAEEIDLTSDTNSTDDAELDKTTTQTITYGSNPFEVFVGHPSKDYDEGSYGCYAEPIVTSLKILGINCTNISGCDEDTLFEYIRQGMPVVVWGTYNGADVVVEEEWIYPDGSGSYTKLTGEHCMVLIGYDDENVYLNDPIAGECVTQTREKFFENFEILYSQAIVIY